jgi:tripartite-type tricarboxylate transporter receptor subunit TctC
MSLQRTCAEIFITSVVCLCLLANASAQSVDSFYKGRTVSVLIGYPAGGSNDIYARIVAHHIGKHIPGNPTLVPRNMPGGGSLVAANNIFNLAPKDGTVLGYIAPTIPLEEKLGAHGVKFTSSAFNWIGRIAPSTNITFAMKTAPVKTIADAFDKELIVGATGRSSTVAIYPGVLNNVVGTKFKLVMGYEGSNAAMLAMERGEVEGHSTSWDGAKAAHPDWFNEKRVNILVQYALKRHPDLPDVPTAVELGRTAEQVQILRLVMNATELGKMIVSTPDTPADRIQALRRAFDAMVEDSDFRAELAAAHLELNPIAGEELQALVEEVGSVSPVVLDRVKAIYPLN